MAKYKIVHYLNQFFGGIGGEDKADFQPEVREEIIGPGMALNEDWAMIMRLLQQLSVVTTILEKILIKQQIQSLRW